MLNDHTREIYYDSVRLNCNYYLFGNIHWTSRSAIFNFSVYDLLFISDTEFISCSRDKTIKIWNSETFSLSQRIEAKNGGHLHSVNKLIKIGAKSFASCSDDKRIMLFEG